MLLRKFYTSHQSSSSPCDEYFKTLLNLRGVISHCGGITGNHPFLVETFLKAADMTDKDNPTEYETAGAKTATEKAYMSTSFLSGLNNTIYGALLNKLHKAFHLGRNEYPKMVTSINWKGDTKGGSVTPNDGVAFTTKS